MLVEGEFLYDEIVVVFESLFTSLRYAQVKLGWYELVDNCGVCPL